MTKLILSIITIISILKHVQAYKCCTTICCPASLLHVYGNEDLVVYSNETDQIRNMRSAIIIDVNSLSEEIVRDKRSSESGNSDSKKPPESSATSAAAATSTTTKTTSAPTSTTRKQRTILRPQKIKYIFEGRECDPKCSQGDVRFANCDREYRDCNPRESLERCSSWWKNCQHRLRPRISNEPNYGYGRGDYDRHNHDDDFYYKHHGRGWRRGWRRHHAGLIEWLDR